jgi:RNA polymerase sigma-70 factor (ECF subfamily)
LEHLCSAYWFPLYAYVRRRGFSAPDAEDLTQGFFAQLLQGDRFQLLAEEKGRLRAYLLQSIKNFITRRWEHDTAQKRGGGVWTTSIDQQNAEERYQLEPSDPNADPERIFEMRWAMMVLERSFEALGAECETTGKADVFEALGGFLTADAEDNRRAAAEQLGISEGAARVALHRLRKRYRALLEKEVAGTLTEPEDVKSEIEHLFSLFQSP